MGSVKVVLSSSQELGDRAEGVGVGKGGGEGGIRESRSVRKGGGTGGA